MQDMHVHCQGDCLSGIRHVSCIVKHIPFAPISTIAYNLINEKETIVFHGTSSNNAEAIMKDGFLANKCVDPSMGMGTYVTTCIKLANSMSVDDIVIMCKVKLGSTKVFDTLSAAHTKSVGYNSGSHFQEFVVYEDVRLMPLCILECKSYD